MVGSISGIIFTKRGKDVDAELIRGASVSFGLVWGGQNSPLDVTGFTANLQVKAKATDASAAFEFKNANSRVTIGGVNGVITFSMTAADSAALTLGDYVYALEIIDASAKNIPVMSGKFKVIPGVV